MPLGFVDGLFRLSLLLGKIQIILPGFPRISTVLFTDDFAHFLNIPHQPFPHIID